MSCFGGTITCPHWETRDDDGCPDSHLCIPDNCNGKCPTWCPKGTKPCGDPCNAECINEIDERGCPNECPEDVVCSNGERKCTRPKSDKPLCRESYCEPVRDDGCPIQCPYGECESGKKMCNTRYVDGCPKYTCQNITFGSDDCPRHCDPECKPENVICFEASMTLACLGER